MLTLIARGLSNAEIAAQLVRQRRDGEDPRRARARQARPARPRAGRRPRLRVGPRAAGERGLGEWSDRRRSPGWCGVTSETLRGSGLRSGAIWQGRREGAMRMMSLALTEDTARSRLTPARTRRTLPVASLGPRAVTAGHQPELEQDAEPVRHAPVLDDLPVHHPQHVEHVDAIGLPVGGLPRNEPSLVPVARLRVHTMSSSTTRSWIFSRKSGNAWRSERMTAFRPRRPSRGSRRSPGARRGRGRTARRPLRGVPG